MDDFQNNYITAEEYREYFRKNLNRDNSLSEVNRKFRKALKNNTFGDNVVEKDNIIYIKKEYFNDSIKLYGDSVEITFVAEKIIEAYGEDINSLRNIRRVIEGRCNSYRILLVHRKATFISKYEFQLIMDAIKEIKEKECIRRSQLLNKINNSFQGIEYKFFPERLGTKFIKENKLEFMNNEHMGNFYPNAEYLYPKETVDKVMENFNADVKSSVKLINMDFYEYLALNKTDFENDYKVLEREEYVTFGESINSSQTFDDIYTIFKDTNVKLIWIQNDKTYVSKKEFYEYVDFRNSYVPATVYLNNLGIKYRNDLARNNGIEAMAYKMQYYIKKEDIDSYIHVYNYNLKFRNANSLYDKVRIKINYYPNKNDDKYPKFKEYLMDFIKYVNKRVNTTHHTYSIYAIYNTILDNIKKDLDPKNEIENDKLFSKLIRLTYESQNNRRMLIQFINYLIDNRKFKLKRIIDVKEKNIKGSYTKEQFISLLSKLIEIVSNENNLKKLYRNWNLSSAVSYVFMHYCLAWRRMDLISQLPKPNLSSISNDITDGESFLIWLENGNEITYEMAKDICKSLEEETKRLRKTAKKNGIKLSCIISDALVKEVATLLCINEANREIHSEKLVKSRIEERCFNAEYTRPTNIQILFEENFNIDIEEILDGRFDNIRMNKGFLTLVKEKAEELNLFAYQYTQVLRGHASMRGGLAETTKIYLDKDIEKASLMAFSTGTMGSITYILNSLVDEDFENKSMQEQIEGIENLNMTPYTIEKNIKTISNKISKVKNEIERFLKQGGYKKGFLQDLLYGQDSYGIEEKTKCLIKITKKEELGIIRVKSMNYKEENSTNKWCPFNRRSCIGCEYMIALRYFVYEFEKKFNQVLNDLELAKSQLDKEIAIEGINSLYIPVLNDLGIIIGYDEVSKVIDTERYKKLVETI
ncbi:hypothetical protein [Clostridium sp.]|uniref:hypothetical protein n=1 Tax=Clostridium sp. TaxID=1506 RepID=UPI00290ADFED|nr:hypothetical protein [Clostridium sp.]MDU5107343.1 hypothetical protein [Clostridium sp.]